MALRAMARTLFRGKADKRHLVWIYGVGNTGKSEFIEKVHAIFASDWV